MYVAVLDNGVRESRVKRFFFRGGGGDMNDVVLKVAEST